jgi:hypothetical protein
MRIEYFIEGTQRSDSPGDEGRIDSISSGNSRLCVEARTNLRSLVVSLGPEGRIGEEARD